MKKIKIVLIIFLIFNIISCYILYKKDSTKYKSKNKFIMTLNDNDYIELDITKEYKEGNNYYSFNGETKDVIISGEVNNKKIGKNVIKYSSDYNDLNTYNLYKIVYVVDKENPIIKLKSDKVIKLYVGDKYNEPGFIVTDNSFENLDNKVVITGKVNTQKEGRYVLNYEVSDSSKNVSKIQREVIVEKKKVVNLNYSSSINKKNITKNISSEKGSIKKSVIDYSKNSNIVESMHFNSNGIIINGYVKDGNGKYNLKLCNQNKECTIYNTKSNKKNYSISIDLRNIQNGIYNVILNTNNNDINIINELSTEERIVRTKIGDKLITVLYDKNNTFSIKVEDFKYQYDVLIDVGHGGSDSGASNSLILEKNINLTQSLYEKKRFEEHGLKVLITRENDSYGLQMGDNSLSALRRKAYAIGYYGVVSKIVYGNHHNSISDPNYSGYELILTNQGSKSLYSVEYSIANEWSKIYPISDKHTRIYGRNYDTDAILSKENGQIYNIKNYYAVQRIPYELFNIYTVTYEGCYLSNMNDFNWYLSNWKKLSEIKIKKYVESLGITYKEV